MKSPDAAGDKIKTSVGRSGRSVPCGLRAKMVIIAALRVGIRTRFLSAGEISTEFSIPLERKDLYEGATTCNRGRPRADFDAVLRRERARPQAAPGQSAGGHQDEQPGGNQQKARRLVRETGPEEFRSGFRRSAGRAQEAAQHQGWSGWQGRSAR